MKGSVRKRGDKWSYYFSYKQDGKYKKKEKGGFATKKEAESALREALHLYDKTNVVKQFNSSTLYDYTILWLDNEAPKYLKPKTLKLYRESAERFKKEIGHIKLTEINPLILRKFLEGEQNRYSESHVNMIRKVLNNVFKYAIDEEILFSNPLSLVKLNKKAFNQEREQNKKALTKEEINQLLDIAKNTEFYLPFILALQMGLGRSEVLGLTWDNIDFEQKTLTIDKLLHSARKNEPCKFGATKTESRVRTIKMTQTVIDVLKQEKIKQEELRHFYGELYYNGPDTVCRNENGKPIDPNSEFSSRLARFIKNDAPFHFRFHDLRHTHATLSLQSGANIKAIQARLGHSRIETTLNIYSHVTDELENELVALFESELN